MHIRHQKQHLSKQSSLNIQLSSQDGFWKKSTYPKERKKRINVHISNPEYTN